jgi:hypothetical protein
MCDFLEKCHCDSELVFCDNYRLIFNFARLVPIVVNKKKDCKKGSANLHCIYLILRMPQYQSCETADNNLDIDTVFVMANSVCISTQKSLVRQYDCSKLD